MSRKLRDGISFVAGWACIGWMMYHQAVNVPLLIVCAAATGVAGGARAIDLWRSVSQSERGRSSSSQPGPTHGPTSDG